MKNNNHYINKLIHPIESNEIDLCADISEQFMHVVAYERSFNVNEYCVNCEKQPCQCHLMPTNQTTKTKIT